tara:strand:- start:2943 stop:4499 length:1557 start_codon:yes stop_codon:yes gene_type:complete
MKILFTLTILLLFQFSFAQTWSDDVAQIVYNKCAQCHHTGGVGGFSLLTYPEANAYSSLLEAPITNEEMPPWPPENEYQSYTHDRSLTASEKTTFLGWITNGTPEGNPANTPPPPVFTAGSILGNGDLEIQIPTYMSKATSTSDDYVCFALPSNLSVDRIIKSVEIIPGNPAIVHHALIFLDPSGASTTDTIGGDCGGPNSVAAELVMGYTPGSSPMTLPASSPLKLGIPFPANSQVLFNMHYPEGSYGEYDSTKVIFHFYPPGETGVRDVLTSRVLENWSFSLPANQITDVNAIYPASGGLLTDMSLLSVFPHMHLLGESMRVYGIESTMDTLKLINIPEWDFEWQDFYFYEYIQKAPLGTVLKLDATFDNTSANINNPNSPPINVGPGLNTNDEMCLVYMHYMLYQTGDELFNIDSLMNLSSASLIEKNLGNDFKVYPNPFTDEIKLYSDHLKPGDQISVSIYDGQGRFIQNIIRSYQMETNVFEASWNGKDLKPGVYFLSINSNGNLSHQRIVKQ